MVISVGSDSAAVGAGYWFGRWRGAGKNGFFSRFLMRFGAKWLQIGAFRCCYGVRRFLHCFARFLHVFCGKCGKLTGRGETAHGGRRELRWIARMRENMDIHNGAKISFERRNSRIFLTTIEPCMVMTRIAARKTSQFSRLWVYFAAILRDFRGKARIFRFFSPKMRKIVRPRGSTWCG